MNGSNLSVALRIFYNIALFVAFVAIYLTEGIYIATLVVMAGVAGEIGLTLALRQRVSKLQWIGLAIVLLLGGLTLLVHNDVYIKLRPTAVYWLIALAFGVSFVVLNKNPIEMIVGRWFHAPDAVWRRLAKFWVLLLFAVGAANLPVALLVSTDVWVIWRVLVAPGLILAVVAAQVVQHRRYFNTRQRTSMTS